MRQRRSRSFAIKGESVVKRLWAMIPLMLAMTLCGPTSAVDPQAEDQGPSLQMDHDIVSEIVFVATFDGVADLNLSCDEGWMCAAESIRDVVRREKITPQVAFHKSIIQDGGLLRDAIRFRGQTRPILFYKADDFHNGGPAKVPNWSATISVWVRSNVDENTKNPDSGAKANVRGGTASILQLTQPKDSGPTLSVELESSELRLMASPHSRITASNAETDQMLVRVKRAPFADGKWHHLCVTVDRVNLPEQEVAPSAGGVVSMFLDGRRMGRATMSSPMTFDHTKAALVIGHRFDGLLDHLWVADRSLSDREIRRVYEKPELFR
jgi:hypothetical protein